MEGLIPALDVLVAEPTHVSEARRSAVRLAQSLSFEEDSQARLALVVTEIATNVLKHAKAGRVVLSPAQDGAAIDAFGIDHGPGMPNLAECLRDGFSTAGSAGTGLGAIERQSDDWDIFSLPGQGTVIRAHFCRNESYSSFATSSAAASFEAVGVVVPYPGCSMSGDAWAIRPSAPGFTLLAVDGLGHGPMAADAAWAAVSIFRDRTNLSGAALLEEIDRGLTSTRGAAAAIAEVSPESGTLRYTGVGNIAGVIYDGSEPSHLVSMNGIVGHRMGRAKSFEYPWQEGSLLILHSDGLRTRWNLGEYRGLAAKSPALIAAVLLRDAGRGTDDVSVVVARTRGSKHAG